jgi:hypothetical protein
MQIALLEGVSTPPGRVQTFINEPYKGTTPHSCTLIVYKNDIWDLLQFCSKSLRWGAGVKVILDDYADPTPVDFTWGYYLSPDHPDYNLLAADQRHYLVDDLGGSTLITVADSMEESTPSAVSIEESWRVFIEAARRGDRIVVDLSSLRPSGTKNDKGLVSTGPIGKGKKDDPDAGSFFAIYRDLAKYLGNADIGSLLQLLGTINDTLRRGGAYKGGIITSAMYWRNPHFSEYLAVPVTSLAGGHKKGVRVCSAILGNKPLLKDVARSATEEGTFLAKVQNTSIYENVCQGLFLPDRGTCLIWRLNIALCRTFEEIAPAMCKVTEELCNLHVSWRKQVGDRANLFAPLEQDRQIGVDILGLANALAYWGITYMDLTLAIERFIEGRHGGTEADRLVFHLADAYRKSTILADEFMRERGLPLLERIHTIEPSQNHAYHCKDLRGFTTARSIFAPFGQKVRRVSNSQRNMVVKHGAVETAADVGPTLHQHFCEQWQALMELCGRAHSISFDSWEAITPDWIEDWMASPLLTKYYTEHTRYNQEFLRKQAIAACDVSRPGECLACAD